MSSHLGSSFETDLQQIDDAANGGEVARARKPSTPRQRLYARTLMQELELSTFEITLLHRRHFVLANLGEARHGRRVDEVLESLTQDQLSALIREYEREISTSR